MTGQSLFLIEKGFDIYILFDWESPVTVSILKKKLNCQEAKVLVEYIHES